MMQDYFYNIQPKSVTVHFADGDAFTFPSEHKNFDAVRRAISEKRPSSDIKALMDTVGSIVKEMAAVTASGFVKADRNGVTYKGKEIHGTIVERIKEHIVEGLDTAPLIAFLEKLLLNHRREAVLSLFDFLDANDIPLTEDGDFVVYKKVRADYRDIHSGTFDNSVGATPRVEPWEVEADRNVTCAKGLHVCSRQYLPHFGGDGSRVVICKVNPADVVAVPNDYNNAKMRVCGYVVIGEIDSSKVAELLDQRRIVTPSTTVAGATWGDNFKEADEDYSEEEEDGECDCGYPSSECSYPDCASGDGDDEGDDVDASVAESLAMAAERAVLETPPTPLPVDEPPVALPPQKARFTWFGRR